MASEASYEPIWSAVHTHPQDESYVVLEGTPRPEPEELDRIFREHGQVNLGPPLGPDD